MTEPVLCYVDANFAFFTPRPLDEQTGDDWNDRPYEHNAGEPYGDDIVIVAFRADLYRPCDGHLNSPYSVEAINRGACPWLRDRYGDSEVTIGAGCTLAGFKDLVRLAGGTVYVEKQA